MSGVSCQVLEVSHDIFFFTKWLQLSVEGLLSTGPTLPGLEKQIDIQNGIKVIQNNIFKKILESCFILIITIN